MFASLARPDDDAELHWLKVKYTFDPQSTHLLFYLFIRMVEQDAPPDQSSRPCIISKTLIITTKVSLSFSLYKFSFFSHLFLDAGFFVFPDLSVRTEGSYRLKLSLFEVVS